MSPAKPPKVAAEVSRGPSGALREYTEPTSPGVSITLSVPAEQCLRCRLFKVLLNGLIPDALGGPYGVDIGALVKLAHLTPRQAVLATLWAHGSTKEQIAEAMGIQPRSVWLAWARVIDKLYAVVRMDFPHPR